MPRYPALDGLRGVAILMVVVFHWHLAAAQPPWPLSLLHRVAGAGTEGVNLFFVLSGFLITGILWDTKTEAHYLRNFFVRRVLRIFPLYYGALLVGLVLVPLIHPVTDPKYRDVVHHQIWLWLYLSNIYETYSGRALPLFGHFWSLAVEEHFYLVWPFVVLACSRRTLMGICLGCVAGSFLVRWALLHAGADPALAVLRLTPCQADCLASGGFLALWLRRPGPDDVAAVALAPVARVLALSGLMVAALTLGIKYSADNSFSFASLNTFWAVFFSAALLLAALGAPGGAYRRLLQNRALMQVGKYSYALYVFHWPLGRLTLSVLQRAWYGNVAPVTYGFGFQLLYFSVSLALSLTAAWLSWHLYERHFLRLKRFFDYHHGTTLRGATT